MKHVFLVVLLFIAGFAGGQTLPPTMDYSTITHPVSRAAIEAWQKGDAKAWNALFVPNAQLLDDGNPRDLHRFSSEAIGHERFTSIDRVEDNGLSIYGRFHSDTWGDFRTYFKFHVNKDGKIDRLEIGQA